MTYLTQSTNRLEQMMAEMEQMIEREVTETLIREFSPHLHNRTVIFEESMGSVTFQVNLRNGRKLIITDDLCWVREIEDSTTILPAGFEETEWVQRAMQLIRDYSELSNRTSSAIYVEVTL